MAAILAPILEWITAVAWPALVRLAAWTGLASVAKLAWQWLALFFGEKIMQSLVASLAILALLEAWGVFLLVFWNFSAYATIQSVFSANPFGSVNYLAGSLYLATNFFPFHFFFGTAIAYIQWRLTVVHAAIVLNRLVRIMQGM